MTDAKDVYDICGNDLRFRAQKSLVLTPDFARTQHADAKVLPCSILIKPWRFRVQVLRDRAAINTGFEV